MLRIVPYRPGVVTDDTRYASEGYAVSSDKIRWVQGRAQSLGGWQQATQDVMPGITRNMFPYVTLSGTATLILASNSKWAAFRDPRLYNITPSRSTGAFSANQFQTVTGSATVTGTLTNHGGLLGDTIYLSNVAAFAGIQLGGLSGTLSAGPFTTISGSRVVAVSHSGHGLASWDQATFTGASAVAGITINGTYLAYVLDSTQYLIEANVLANATTSGGGTPAFNYGKAYTLTGTVTTDTFQITGPNAATASAAGGNVPSYLFEMNVGRINSVASPTGYGTKGWSQGLYGTAPGSDVPTQAATTAIDTYGEVPILNRLGGSIYQWNNIFSQRATVVTNAPAKSNFVLVTAERALMAFGCTGTDGIFDPMRVRWSDLTDRTIWTPSNTNTAGGFRLGVGSFIVCARHTRDGILVWTDTSLYFIRYNGDPDSLYEAVIVGTNCGAAGPNAVIEQDGLAYWITPQLNIYYWNGGTPKPVPCPVREVAFANIIDRGQVWKISLAYDNAFTGVYFFFPTPDTMEVSRYIRLDILESQADARSGWSIGTFDRPAWIDDTTFNSPMAVDTSGILYAQESGLSANGAVVTRYVEWAPIDLSGGDLGDGDRVMNATRVVANMRIDSGTVSLTFTARRWPTGPATTKGPYTVTAGTQKNDIRIQGRQLAMQITSSGASDDWRQGDIRMDLSPGTFR